MSFVLVRSCGAAYMLLVAIMTITCVHHKHTSRTIVHKHASFQKNTRVELQNTRMLPTRVLKSLNRAVPQLFAYVTVPNLAKITSDCVSPYPIKRNFKLDISLPYTTDKSIYRSVTDLLYLLHVCYMSVTVF